MHSRKLAIEKPALIQFINWTLAIFSSNPTVTEGGMMWVTKRAQQGTYWLTVVLHASNIPHNWDIRVSRSLTGDIWTFRRHSQSTRNFIHILESYTTYNFMCMWAWHQWSSKRMQSGSKWWIWWHNCGDYLLCILYLKNGINGYDQLVSGNKSRSGHICVTSQLRIQREEHHLKDSLPVLVMLTI